MGRASEPKSPGMNGWQEVGAERAGEGAQDRRIAVVAAMRNDLDGVR